LAYLAERISGPKTALEVMKETFSAWARTHPVEAEGDVEETEKIER
jgi:hypothetical protein